MNKRTARSMDAKIAACSKKIAAERDKLDEIISGAMQIVDDCDEALIDLERARDALSRWL